LDIAQARGFTSLKSADMSDIQGFIFVSSAKAVTPFHYDAEDNIFVQVHGDKAFHIFNNDDRALVSDESYEISPAKHRNMPYKEEFEQWAQVFEMKAGDGMFVPYLWPHWVRTGSSYSISMALHGKHER
jgi:ribosomal protein L16 Arg81 hydroxylase